MKILIHCAEKYIQNDAFSLNYDGNILSIVRYIKTTIKTYYEIITELKNDL
ncbi:MAG: hypothetical protein ABIJ40_10730 [Bacteroidota bacterium]|nr:hypothetical protein [Bacteroidota bacterium]